jgi:hypothetical protein
MAEAPQAGGGAPAPARAPAAPPAPPEKKEPKTYVDFIEWLFFIFIAIAFLMRAATGFNSPGAFGNGISLLQKLAPDFSILLRVSAIFADVLCLFFLIAIIYSVGRTKEIAEKWYNALYPAPAEAASAEEKVKNPRWQLVVNHISSENPSDWRLAILESDIILADLFDSLGYQGDTVGDKLRSAEKAPFNTLSAAWEAHRIRNAIAHEGADFTLTEREARRIVGLYESVFREFDYI